MQHESRQAGARDIAREDFDRFRRLIHETCGISLGETKDALLTSRVARRMRQLGLESHGEYFDTVIGDRSGAELQCLVDAVSTNVTSFFREPEHFDVLRTHLAALASDGVTEVRLWSAACSTGEEPYSMAMAAAESVALHSTRVRILATDISTGALSTAHAARYPADRVSKMPVEYASRYLRRCRDGQYEVSPALRGLVRLSPINLARPPFPMRGPFDAVFCRNVMIYFDQATRQRLVLEIERLLAPGGLLMLGHAESLAGIDCGLKSLAPAVYRKAGR